MATGYEIYAFRAKTWQFIGALSGERAEVEKEAFKILQQADTLGVRLVEDTPGPDGAFKARVVLRRDKTNNLPPFRIDDRPRGGGGGPKRAAPPPQRPDPAPQPPPVPVPRPAPAAPPVPVERDPVAATAVAVAATAAADGRGGNLFAGIGGFLADLFASFIGGGRGDGARSPGAARPRAAEAASALVEPRIEDEDFKVDATRKAVVRQDTETLLRYLYSNLRHVRLKTDFAADGKLASSDVFACYLFFAGAAESLARHLKRPQNEFRSMIAMSLRNIAKSDEGAKTFALHYEEYLADPRQAKIFAAGRDGYVAWTRGAGSFEALARILAEFRTTPGKEAPKDAAPDGTKEVITVMFTDIVGSTEHSATHGDELHMQLIAAHDHFVRGALNAFRGVEIKHLGDGIMASFASVPDAVRAGLRIQTEVANTPVADPRLALTIKIGLNAGTPVRMGADLFGSTVQMAARICSVCPPGAVAVSEGVVASYPGGAGLFRPAGAHRLKGFPEPVNVFAVAPGSA
jgi:class 3 adenylate cyclase